MKGQIVQRTVLAWLSVILIVGASVFKSTAQEQPNLLSSDKVTTITYWELGDERSYRVTNSSEVIRNGKEEKHQTPPSSYNLHFRVTNQTDTSYSIEMRYSDVTIPKNERLNDDPLFEELMTLSNKQVIEFRTNELGGFIEIANKEEIIENLSVQLDMIEAKLAEMTDEEELVEVMKILMTNVRSMTLAPENIDALYAKDIQLFHGYYGFEFELGVAQAVEMEYPILGDLVVPGEGKLVVRTINADADRFNVHITDAPYDDALKASMQEIVMRLTDGIEHEKMDLDEVDFKVSGKANYAFELSSGWVYSISSTNTTTVRMGKDTVKTASHITVKPL